MNITTLVIWGLVALFWGFVIVKHYRAKARREKIVRKANETIVKYFAANGVDLSIKKGSDDNWEFHFQPEDQDKVIVLAKSLTHLLSADIHVDLAKLHEA